jgi:hypothetical protein
MKISLFIAAGILAVLRFILFPHLNGLFGPDRLQIY